MVGLLVLGCEKGDGPFGAGLHTGSPVFSAAVPRPAASAIRGCGGGLSGAT